MPPQTNFTPDALPVPIGLLAFMVVWFLFVGGCIGSFMNVVIYRSPLGKSVVSPGSRCPRCLHAIRWYDNLPVISWLILRGQCRDCGLPIAFRYPLVELIVALVFLSLAVEVILPHGAWWLVNISPRGFLSESWLKLALAYLFYQLLICTLLCAAYITWDGLRVPAKLYWPVLLASLLLPCYWNEVRPFGVSSTSWLTTLQQGLWQEAVGASCGLILGLVYDRIRDVRNARGEPRSRVALAGLTIGAALGWQCAATALALGGAIAMIWPLLLGRSWRVASAAPLAGLSMATIALVLAGRWFIDHWPELFRARSGTFFALSLLTILVSAILARLLGPLPEPAPTDEQLSSPDTIYP